MKPLIVLGVSGSIAAVRSFDLCRELRRRGFDVQVVMSNSARNIITEQSLEFASGRKVINSISGKIEHVKFFGKKGMAALLLIAPATANTISKIAMGIDDTPITTFATVAIGSSKPVLLAPAMHGPMYEHPIVLENLAKLEKHGVRVIAPLEEEGKAKLASIEKIIFEVQKELSEGKLDGKSVLVASGAFCEKIDDVRVLTNLSSGKIGNEIALECAMQKAKVKLIGNGAMKSELDFEEVVFADELEEKVLKELQKGYDYFFCPASIPDFKIKKFEGKISSEKQISLTLSPQEKLLTKVSKKAPKLKIIAFKALWAKSRSEIEKIASEYLKKNNFFALVATDLKKSPVGSDGGEFFFCSKKSKWIIGKKSEIAKKIIELI
ncbi:MAG TPA: bifunctional phosphopantothenoylcysteine decarboxylase/phosphopantothenate--cysteine ligase CoaBC [archaeon]|nr:bifunctional phosphopantothenoylcysteine decarboxylase/phosphopantothenate--cysteine ligase CoaBC [archaeon]